MNEIKVSDVMTSLVVAFRPQDGIQEAARRLVANRISGAPVVEQGQLVGIISEADIVSAYAGPAPTGSPFVATDPLMFLLRGRVPRTTYRKTIDEVMTRQVVSILPEASIWQAASLLDRHGVRRLPVVNDKGYLVGVVARADVVSAMARPDEDLATAVRKSIAILGEENFSGLEIDVSEGTVTVFGTADRKTTKDIALRLASQVPGILEVVDELDWKTDDTRIKPVPSAPDPHEVERDPWAVGPLVRESSA